jgi:precorrin-6A/cobalt-precorrin-6A reductase
MRTVLLLGGVGEARELAEALADEPGIAVVSSLAGRVADPRLPAGRVRVGGFGGAAGLAAWLTEHRVDALIDATHPFAATMTRHAATAAAATGVPIVHLRRPGWTPVPADRWIRVPAATAAAEALADLGERVLLTIGRQGVAAFADVTDHWFLIRAIDPPDDRRPPRHELLLARGPFALPAERALLADRRIDVLVTKDSGGAATAAKLVAARERGIPVVVIDRPALPSAAPVVDSVPAALDWLRRLA